VGERLGEDEMTDTPAETMLKIWGRFHEGDQDSFETLLPLFWLRQQAREAEYGRYYRKLEILAGLTEQQPRRRR